MRNAGRTRSCRLGMRSKAESSHALASREWQTLYTIGDAKMMVSAPPLTSPPCEKRKLEAPAQPALPMARKTITSPSETAVPEKVMTAAVVCGIVDGVIVTSGGGSGGGGASGGTFGGGGGSHGGGLCGGGGDGEGGCSGGNGGECGRVMIKHAVESPAQIGSGLTPARFVTSAKVSKWEVDVCTVPTSDTQSSCVDDSMPSHALPTPSTG